MKIFMAAVAASLSALAAPASAADGEAVYSKTCAVCHNAMPPKLGDKAAWAPRIAAGTDALVASTIKGKGAMPARGGKPGLTDAEIKAAVEYIVSRAK